MISAGSDLRPQAPPTRRALPPSRHASVNDRVGREGEGTVGGVSRPSLPSLDHLATGSGRLLAVCCGGVGFVVLLFLVRAGWRPLVTFDRAVAHDLTASLAHYAFLVDILVVIQQLTNPWILRGCAVIVAAYLIRRDRTTLGWWLVTVAAVGAFTEYALKIGIARPRPPREIQLDVVGGYAFPSGHALASALLIGAVLVVVWHLGVGRRVRIAAAVAGAFVVLVIGFDRVALGVHYVSDVLAGWLIALALLGITATVFRIGRPSRTGVRLVRRLGRSRYRVAVILNPSKIGDLDAFRQQVAEIAKREGWAPPLWFETTPDDPGHAMVRAALAARPQLVIVAGGDGTVRVVSAGLAGSGVPLGIVPTGTGNLLVRNLGLPLDRTDAIRVALSGHNRTVDLVRVEGDGLPPDRFAVMAGLGLDAAVVGEAPAKLKARMGWPAYVVSVVRNLSFPAVRVEISVDDAPPVRRWVRTVLVGNVGTLSGGLTVLPDAQPDDGLLDVVAIAPRRLTDWPRLAWRVARRSSVQDERLRTWRGKRVVVRAVDACPRQLDGDVIGLGHELRCEVEPGVLIIRVPPER